MRKLQNKLRVLLIMMLTALTVCSLSVGVMASSNDSADVVVQNAKIGETYTFYKVLSLTTGGTGSDTSYAYSIKPVFESFFNTYFQQKAANDKAYASLAGSAAGTELDSKLIAYFEIAEKNASSKDTEYRNLAVAIKKYIDNLGDSEELAGLKKSFTASEENLTDNKLKISLDSDGYYIMIPSGNDKASVLFSLGTYESGKAFVIKNKSSYPTPTKTAKSENAKDDNDCTASLGEKVDFKVTGKVPDMKGYKYYIFNINDTLDQGFDIVKDQNGMPIAEIIIGDNKLSQVKDSTAGAERMDSKWFYVKDNGNNSYSFVIHDFIQYSAESSKDIVVNYSAVTNKNSVVTTDAVTNGVKFVYSIDPAFEGSSKDEPTESEPVGISTESKTYTYVSSLSIKKIAEENENSPLAGAQFKLEGTRLVKVLKTAAAFSEAENGTYYKLKDGSYTATAPTAQTADKYQDTTKKYNKETVSDAEETAEGTADTVETGSDGLITFKGLGAGTYTITEVKSPDGYNILANPIKIKIDVKTDEDHKAVWKAVYSNDGTEVEKVDVFTYDKTNDSIKLIDLYDSEGNMNPLIISNSIGKSLPSTGGFGTYLIYAVGAVLVAGGLITVFVKMRRRED